LPVHVTGTETGIANGSTGRRFPIVALDTTPPITDDNPPITHGLNMPSDPAYQGITLTNDHHQIPKDHASPLRLGQPQVRRGPRRDGRYNLQFRSFLPPRPQPTIRG